MGLSAQLQQQQQQQNWRFYPEATATRSLTLRQVYFPSDESMQYGQLKRSVDLFKNPSSPTNYVYSSVYYCTTDLLSLSLTTLCSASLHPPSEEQEAEASFCFLIIMMMMMMMISPPPPLSAVRWSVQLVNFFPFFSISTWIWRHFSNQRWKKRMFFFIIIDGRLCARALALCNNLNFLRLTINYLIWMKRVNGAQVERRKKSSAAVEK